MNCKAIERLILEGEERALGGDEKRLVEAHFGECPGCRAFEAGRRAIREGLKDFRRAELPRPLDLRTRRLCLEALGSRRAVARKARIPVPVIAASILFAVLAVIWLTATLSEVAPGEPLPSGGWVAIVFIAQNALVLFLSPVILRAARTSKNETSSSPGGF
jgi:anti-sigma factor RsiW